ncbi:MAG: adenosylmethionine decarboxylase [Azospirillum sp.]|nr:adenosylmethionine decarboxylase [Azospirillum sp.]
MVNPASLFQLGIDLAQPPKKAQAEASGTEVNNVTAGPWPMPAVADDHFITRDGKCYAGTHLILDLWGASRLAEIDYIRRALIDAVEAAGATLLHIHLHHFTPNGGVSGVAVLAESHISIHTWPERSYAALDIFMCGGADPQKSVPVLEMAFQPTTLKVEIFYRGAFP